MERSTRALAAALAFGASLGLAAAPARAQPKGANRPPAEVANDLVKQAITKSQAGDHLGAIDLYLSAYSLIPQHALLSNVGAEYQQAGKPIEALKYFCMYLEKDPNGTNATYALAKAKAIQIELGSKSVDDRTACRPPPPQKPAAPGAGGASGAGRSGRADGEGEAEAGGGADARGEAEVTGARGLAPPPGGERRDDGGGARPGRGLRVAGVGVAVVGLASLGVGGYYGLVAKDRSDFLTNYVRDNGPGAPWPANVKEIEAEGQRAEDRQIALSIAGGALAVTGVVLYVIGATRGGDDADAGGAARSAARLRLVPQVAPGAVGVALGRGW